MNPNKELTRKDIARAVNSSVKQVERYERRWGLKPIKHNRRVVVYRIGQASQALLRAGMIAAPLSG